MKRLRIIPRLDVKGDRLVKGVHLEGIRPLGKPEDFALRYYEGGADELLYMDVVASLYGRNSMLAIVERTARDCFIPLTVGGGIRTLDDIRAALRAGADKVAINTAALARPEFVREAAAEFGSSTIVVSIDAKRRGDTWEAYTDGGRERTGIDAVRWATEVEGLGAGELLITSVDRDGTQRGYDADLVGLIAICARVPVIACGGAGSVEHVADVVLRGQADAVGVGSLLHYGGASIEELKQGLRARGIACRRAA